MRRTLCCKLLTTGMVATTLSVANPGCGGNVRLDSWLTQPVENCLAVRRKPLDRQKTLQHSWLGWRSRGTLLLESHLSLDRKTSAIFGGSTIVPIWQIWICPQCLWIRTLKRHRVKKRSCACIVAMRASSDRRNAPANPTSVSAQSRSPSRSLLQLATMRRMSAARSGSFGNS
jgi:hypothetical protein